MQELSQQLTELGSTVGRAAPVSPLSDQEKHVLQLFSEGKDSPEVAAELGISLPAILTDLTSNVERLCRDWLGRPHFHGKSCERHTLKRSTRYILLASLPLD